MLPSTTDRCPKSPEQSKLGENRVPLGGFREQSRCSRRVGGTGGATKPNILNVISALPESATLVDNLDKGGSPINFKAWSNSSKTFGTPNSLLTSSVLFFPALLGRPRPDSAPEADKGVAAEAVGEGAGRLVGNVRPCCGLCCAILEPLLEVRVPA